jgi:outer membrane protein assembly factor BamD
VPGIARAAPSMPLRRYGLLALLALPLAGGLAACGGAGGVVANSGQEAFDKGMLAYEARDYNRAIEFFRAALDFGRSGEWADEAQVYLAKAYYETGQYLLAANEFDRFGDLYPTDPRTEEARFGEIQSYAQLSPPYNLDQTDTERAITLIRTFMASYPQSVFTNDVVALLEQLREKLAQKQYEAGRLYERRELYEAAVLTYRSVLESYPTTSFADEALLGALRAQVAFAEASVQELREERFGEALAFYDRLVELFPGSPLLPEAEALYDRAFAGRQSAEAAAAQAARAGQ